MRLKVSSQIEILMNIKLLLILFLMHLPAGTSLQELELSPLRSSGAFRRDSRQLNRKYMNDKKIYDRSRSGLSIIGKFADLDPVESGPF